MQVHLVIGVSVDVDVNRAPLRRGVAHRDRDLRLPCRRGRPGIDRDRRSPAPLSSARFAHHLFDQLRGGFFASGVLPVCSWLLARRVFHFVLVFEWTSPYLRASWGSVASTSTSSVRLFTGGWARRAPQSHRSSRAAHSRSGTGSAGIAGDFVRHHDRPGRFGTSLAFSVASSVGVAVQVVAGGTTVQVVPLSRSARR